MASVVGGVGGTAGTVTAGSVGAGAAAAAATVDARPDFLVTGGGGAATGASEGVGASSFFTDEDEAAAAPDEVAEAVATAVVGPTVAVFARPFFFCSPPMTVPRNESWTDVALPDAASARIVCRLVSFAAAALTAAISSGVCHDAR